MLEHVNLVNLLLAGVIGTAVLFFFMEVMAPKMLGAPMRPGEMICKILGCSDSAPWLGTVLHYALGLIGFPIGYLIFKGIIGGGLVMGLVYGFLLFLAAALIVAPLAGRGMMFGAMKPAVAALVAHLAYGLVLGFFL